MAAGHCRFSLWSGCSSNYYEAGTSISIMLIESPEFIHGEDVNYVSSWMIEIHFASHWGVHTHKIGGTYYIVL